MFTVIMSFLGFFLEKELDVKFIKSVLIKYGLNYHDQKLSWHYHLFAGFKRKFEERNIKCKKK